MKKVFTFLYCDGILSPRVRVFLVAVGRSLRDRRACAFVSGFVRDNAPSCFFAENSVSVQNFLEQCEVSFSLVRGSGDVMRRCSFSRKFVAVGSLARFLRHSPACLLNSAVCPI